MGGIAFSQANSWVVVPSTTMKELEGREYL
jgi:hypothetical protein